MELIVFLEYGFLPDIPVLFGITNFMSNLNATKIIFEE